MLINRFFHTSSTHILFILCLLMWVLGTNKTLAAEKPNVYSPFDGLELGTKNAHTPVLGKLHPHSTARSTSPFRLNDHFCGTDLTSEHAKKALEQYTRDKAAGLYPIASKGNSTPGIVGDERTFKVSENNEWISLSFRLVEVTSLYYLWVEIAELNNGHVTPSDVASLHQAAINSTPSRSINPSQGFFANNHAVYGLPPNVDGDGIVDLLMYDIGRGTGTTLGYVSSADLVIGSGTDIGNERDILYLDSNEGTSSFSTLAAVAAHEYTHLINFTYGMDDTFMSEGFAEYAIDFNGYYWRGTTYFSTPSDVTQNLFNWRTGGGPGAQDYERAALFMTYLGNRVGTLAVGEMLRGRIKKGAAGIDSVLHFYGENLGETIRDFHTANFFNDQSLDPRYGYKQPERSAHHATLTSAPIRGEVQSDVGEGGYVDSFFERVNAGAVNYRRYNEVANLNFTYDVPISPVFGPATQAAARLRNGVKLAYKRAGTSTIEFSDLTPGLEAFSLPGRFEWVLFIFVNYNVGAGVGDRSKLEITWTPLSKVTDREAVPELPAELALEANYPNPFNPQTVIPITLQSAQRIELSVYDALGKRMMVLANGMQTAGKHAFELHAESWPSGSYLVRLTSQFGVQSRMITLVK